MQEMKKRTFGDGGAVPPGGRFSEDVYARARAWMAAGSPEKKDSSAPKPSPKPAPKPIPVKSDSPKASYNNEGHNKEVANIPKDDSIKAPKKSGMDTSGPSNMDRVLVGLGAAGAGAGLYKGYKMLKAGKAAKDASNAAKGSRAVATNETPVKFLGASGRTNVTPKKAIGTTNKPRLEGFKASDRVGMSPKPSTLSGPTVQKALPAPAKPSGRGVPRMTTKKAAAKKSTSTKKTESAADQGKRMMKEVDKKLKQAKKNPYSK